MAAQEFSIKIVKVALLVVFLVTFTSAESYMYYVTPSSNTPCPEEGVPCFTLSQYANQPSNYFASNTTLILLPGNHSLDSELSIRNISFESVESYTTSHSDSTLITCYQNGRFVFESINVVSMRGLVLFGCVNNEITRVEEFTLKDCSLEGQGRNGTGLQLNEVSTAKIMRSSFSSNTGRETYYPLLEKGIRAGGAIIVVNSTLGVAIVDCIFQNNTVTGNNGAGGAVYANSSPITIVNSTLNSNTVTGDIGAGGAVWTLSSHITIVNSTLNSNTVIGNSGSGGAVFARSSPGITIVNTTLNINTVTGSGGAVYALLSPTTIFNSILNSNTVIGDYGGGGAVFAESGSINILNSTLNSNTVTGLNGHGGAVASYSSPNVTIVNSTLNSNTVTGDIGGGGVLSASDSKSIVIDNGIFNNNRCTGKGSVFYLNSVTFNSLLNGFLDIQNNMAATCVLYAVESSLYFSGNTTISNNHGTLFVYSCNVTFMGHTNIMNNSYSHDTTEEGGALTTIQSDIVFMGRVNFMYNSAIRGGAIAATQSKIYIYGDTTISHNSASESGGGIYAYQSELNFENNINISRNSANSRGGGIHAISSMTRLTNGSKTYIVGNYAERGGGMCLESSAKIYLLKSKLESVFPSLKNPFDDRTSSWITLSLKDNTAHYGGAVFVADDTLSTSAICSATPFSDKTTIYGECFIQGLRLYSKDSALANFNILNTYFTDNSATVAGDVFYGGLLDRCWANPFAEIFQKYKSSTPRSLSAVSYLLNITDLKVQDFNSTKAISSDPLRVCFCKDNQPDCSYHPQPKYVRKGERFRVTLVAVDHINNTIANTKIHASVSLKAKLGEGQSIQRTTGGGSCTELVYSIVSPQKSEKLQLYPDGPCMSAGISTVNITVNIAPCPIGFIDNDLRCECDPILSSEYISDCSIDSEKVQRKNNVWFSYVNTTHHQGYILHKHCPFDYCRPPTENISVNLNAENGADEMCTFNRSGKLCGSCEDGLSLSLGSSRCMPCSTNNWLALLIGFAVAGVALVAFILKLNFTVAEGTFNGLIFYANIFAANSTIFFPHDETNILTVFIAWLNLDFGIETCFFNGMDGYAKTWLQFVFPLYVISLVVAIIIISDYSTKFAKLFTGKNPIATLATLILLSYTKLLRTIIASLSFTTLQYSDGSHEVVWLIDANIPYLSGKHIPLFIMALVIVIVGTAYTFILFAWQWLVYCPNRGPLRWTIGSTKVIAFMDAYHNPYNKDHRYWIGLLLLVRVALYLVSALNALGDPRINICSINSAIVIILILQRAVESRRKVSSTILQLKKVVDTIISRKVHKDQHNEILELIFLFNLAGLTIGTFFITEDEDSQNVVAYISTGIAFVTFLAILVYHVYQFVLTELLHKIKSKLHTLQGSHDEIQVERLLPVALDEEPPVSESEFDASPAPMDAISIAEDEQNVTTEEDEDIGTTNMQTGPSNTHKNSSVSSDSSQPLENDNQPLENIPIEIEVPNMAASGHECSTVHGLLQPPVFVETSPEHADHQSESEDECTPLLQ